MASILNELFASVFSVESDSAPTLEEVISARIEVISITEETIVSMIGKLAVGKATGPDGILGMEGKPAKGQEEPVQDAKRQKPRSQHNCGDMKKLVCLRQLEKFKKDPRKEKWMRVRLTGCEDLPFPKGAEKYQKEYYPEAEKRVYSFPAGYVLNDNKQEELFHILEKSKPGTKDVNIPQAYTAVAKVFNCLKEELEEKEIPSFVSYDYDFVKTFHAAMGLSQTRVGGEIGVDESKKRKKKPSILMKKWERIGFRILDGDHDVCGIVFDGERVVVLFFEVKSIERTDDQDALNAKVGKAEEQLKKSEEVFQQIVGATVFTHTFLCCFLAVPSMSKDYVRKTLKCKPDSLCHEKILTENDLESRDAFRGFLEKHGINLTKRMKTVPAAMECYLDVMSTYVAASASVECMPRTVEELRNNIHERMQKALVLLTPHQRQILDDDRSVLFLTGGQGTGKTHLLLHRAQKFAEMGETVVIVNMSEGELTQVMRKWRESCKFEANITIMDSCEFLGVDRRGMYLLPEVINDKDKSFIAEMLVEYLDGDRRKIDSLLAKISDKKDSVIEEMLFEYLGGDRRGIDLLLEKVNEKKDSHVLIDEMLVNFGMYGRDPVEIGQKWKALVDKKKSKSLWITWRPSSVTYPKSLDLQSVVDSLGREKVELLNEIKRSTKELGEFVIEVTRFIQKRFSCYDFLPMQGLEYGQHRSDDPGEEKEIPRVVFVRAPPVDNSLCRWASEAIMAIQSWIPDSRTLTIITRTDEERNVLVRELGSQLGRGRGRAFLDSSGILRGRPNPGLFVFYQDQVTGMSFQNLILLDDEKFFYRSWSRMVGMARETLHVITTDPLPSRHWEEPAEMGFVSCCSLRRPRKSSSSFSSDPLEESSYAEISWISFLEGKTSCLPDAECKFELLFGPVRSGKTKFIFDRLKRKVEEENEEMRKSEETSSRWKTSEDRKEYEKGERKHRIMFLDCSRWNRTEYPLGISLLDVKEKTKREMLNIVEVYDVHDLFQQHGLDVYVCPNPQIVKELLVKMLEKGTNEGLRLHVAFDDVPVARIGSPGDTKSLRVEWEGIISSLSSHPSLASLTIAFSPFILYATTNFDVEKFKKGFHKQGSSQTNVRILEGCWDVGFPRLLRYVLSHESPKELKVKPGTLNTRPQPTSLVFGVRPTLVTPPVGLHYHGKYKCIGGRGRGCIAITAAAAFHSLHSKAEETYSQIRSTNHCEDATGIDPSDSVAKRTATVCEGPTHLQCDRLQRTATVVVVETQLFAEKVPATDLGAGSSWFIPELGYIFREMLKGIRLSSSEIYVGKHREPCQRDRGLISVVSRK
ncbi:unnamed protein product [Darwinula stevensoni]|uniref:Uncharacterized protein n=1 Tax=Darwinula stevensoni TaxID=69355 RepID=A0A7R8X8X4_9CRUS|nr:unnamed protein product [Darwinula stevensoni]CAG0890570.1 unnamed protein product [Darwinula stevensoni]